MKLSEQQNKIVTHKEGALLVMAAAGSGKTRVLTERIKSLLSDVNGKFQVLALTFTNKAADEMKERLKDVKEVQERTFIGTFHAFCLEILKNYGHAIGMDQMPQIFERQEDRLSILMQVITKEGNEDLLKIYQNREGSAGQQQFVYNALTYISTKKKHLKGIDDFNQFDNDLGNEKVQRIFDDYNLLLRRQGAMDFDDIIINAYRILAERPKVAKLIRQQYKYISIDEAQDLNFAQYELLKALCGDAYNNILMVGDVKQSLYHFNGSDIKYMKDHFKQDFSANEINLNTNYRSAQRIIKVANKIKPSAMIGANPDLKGSVELWPCKDEKAEAIQIIDKIEELLYDGRYVEGEFEDTIEPKDIAILARSRYLFKSIEEQLIERQVRLEEKAISYHFKKGADNGNWDSSLIRLFDLGLRIMAYPADEFHFIEITNELGLKPIEQEKPWTTGYDKLQALKTKLSSDKSDQFDVLLEAWQWVDRKFDVTKALKCIATYTEQLQSNQVRGVNELHEPIAEYNLNQYQRDKEIEEIIADLERFNEQWRLYSRNTPYDQKNLQHFKTQLSLGTIIPQNEEEGITLSTIHLSKGLEFKVVFIIGLDQGSLPYYKSLKARGEKLEEERNIFYVGVTRAQRLLYISYPRNRYMPWDKDHAKPQNPSEYLKDLEGL